MQEKHDVALIVVDTLREDFAEGLEKLKGMGFVEFSNAVSTSSWTLPSHVSMFTGELPSRHLVHVSLGVHMGTIMQRSRAGLEGSKSNVLRAMRDLGYKRYCFTCNPFVTPRFGFEFDWNREYRPMIETSQLRDVLPPDGSMSSRAWAALKAGRLLLLAKLATRKVRLRINRGLNLPVKDKGSRQALKDLRRANLPTPYFVYLNLMEAHEPYRWGEPTDATRRSMLKLPVRDMGWGKSYPEGSGIAVGRALEAVEELLKKGDPTIIITSDHGQLLGEGGRYGHGYFMDEALLRVPLYVRFPSGTDPPSQTGDVVSLAQIHSLISWATGSPVGGLGGREAVAEGFGPHFDLRRYLAGEGEAQTLEKMYEVKRRVFSKDGSVLYNVSTRALEESNAASKDEEARLAGVAESLGVPPAPPDEALGAADEAGVMERLSKLGYV
ncbi:MAG: sulfatase-like hydrolase/transferase [Nitrososphaerota archaeon]|nr:sulfatase-like hydrolase/transferase [Nitrososphaerota archaeon]MDG6937443.1 sulfatase-like hydrolase/transferase [Nitrososphaerota archaeon]MDG6958675.1 sulfatase-like hydrolase/transferase [Nitrososphaerota archaeon]MDG6971262.1 sulfatase-like hydrolase/transferase [Nitrososphaerota archaeon]MDG6972694.1 sulfatase-like hydrolase/transferase [Nitrososphaerota archaeon]